MTGRTAAMLVAAVEPSVEFRLIDYNERVLPRNDYRASIVAFKLTRRFHL